MDTEDNRGSPIEGEYWSTAQKEEILQRFERVMDEGPPENWGRLHALLGGVEQKTVGNVGCIAGIENGQFVLKRTAVLTPNPASSEKLVTQL
jgi:hypothetical protein